MSDREQQLELEKIFGEFEERLDEQIYPEQVKDDFDAPDDRIYELTITAGLWRRFGKAMQTLAALKEADATARQPDVVSGVEPDGLLPDERKWLTSFYSWPYSVVHTLTSRLADLRKKLDAAESSKPPDGLLPDEFEALSDICPQCQHTECEQIRVLAPRCADLRKKLAAAERSKLEDGGSLEQPYRDDSSLEQPWDDALLPDERERYAQTKMQRRVGCPTRREGDETAMSYPHFSTDCHEYHQLVRDFGTPQTRPFIVCLCGSTRFYKEFVQANYDETMAGRIVLSVGFFGHAKDDAHYQTTGITPADKGRLDELHKRKIDLCDEVYVLNVAATSEIQPVRK